MPVDDKPAELPAFFRRMLLEQYGSADADRVIAGCRAARPVTMRANTLKCTAGEVRARLDDLGFGWRGVPWFDEALVLDGRVREADLRPLDLYAGGMVYLQSLSSMIPPVVLRPADGSDILDMCAAPGGKTCQMAAMTGGRAHITACEMHMPRAERLEHNLRVQGASTVSVMRCDARRLDDFFRFDQILLDAPCTGSGTLRASDPKLPARFTEQLLAKSVRSQRALLDKATRLLKEGGTLVYSTCSVLRQENDDAVAEVLRSRRFEIDPIDAGAFGGVGLLPSMPGTLTVCPDGLYEGFFVARLRKVG